MKFLPARCAIITLCYASSICLAAAAEDTAATGAAASSSSVQKASSPQHSRSVELASATASSLPEAPLPAMLRSAAGDASDTAAPQDSTSPDANPPDTATPAHKVGAAATNGLGSRTVKASPTQKYIEPGQAAPQLTAGDKVMLGVRDPLSTFSAAGWFVSAGWEQLNNSSPNYGTDRGAFGERLGAAAIRSISEGIFSDSVMSPILHTDPRYYRLGRSHGFFGRAVYAATRPLITRTDGGRMTPNFALIVGNAGGSALTNLYYPSVNTGTKETLETFGGSMGGSALGFLVSEFYDDIVHPHRR